MYYYKHASRIALWFFPSHVASRAVGESLVCHEFLMRVILNTGR